MQTQHVVLGRHGALYVISTSITLGRHLVSLPATPGCASKVLVLDSRVLKEAGERYSAMDPIHIRHILDSLVASADSDSAATHAAVEAHGGQQSAVTLDLDHSFFFQLAIVLLLMAVLNKLVFKPFLRSVEARDAKTTHMRAEAAALRGKAESLRAQYDESLSAARKEANSARRALRVEGIDDKDGRIKTARVDATRVQSDAEAQMQAQFDVAREQLLTQVDGISRQVVEKVLGRGV